MTKWVPNQLVWGNHRNLIICTMNPSKRQGNSKHISNQIVIFKAQMKQARFYWNLKTELKKKNVTFLYLYIVSISLTCLLQCFLFLSMFESSVCKFKFLIHFCYCCTSCLHFSLPLSLPVKFIWLDWQNLNAKEKFIPFALMWNHHGFTVHELWLHYCIIWSWQMKKK